MIDRQDRDAIEGLFDRLADVARRAPHRDPDADALIEAEMRRLPGAAYYMAQTIVVEQQALEAAERRIQELEDELSRRSRGFGGLFDDGHGRQNRAQPQEVERQTVRPRGPWDRGGGGFLAGAMQTAFGVAGGVLLGSAIGSLLGAGSANAGDQVRPLDSADNGDADPSGFDNGGFDDFGGDGFDIGGDF